MKLSKGFSFVLLSTFFFIIVTARESRAVTLNLNIVPVGGDPSKPQTFTGLVEPPPPNVTQYVQDTLAPSGLLWKNEPANTVTLKPGDTTVINSTWRGQITLTTGTNSVVLPVEVFQRLPSGLTGDESPSVTHPINITTSTPTVINPTWRGQITLTAGTNSVVLPVEVFQRLPSGLTGDESPTVTPTINITTPTPEPQADMIARQRARAGKGTPSSWLTVESSSFTFRIDVTGRTPDEIARLKARIGPDLPWQLTEGTNVAQPAGGQQPGAGGAAGTGTAPAGQPAPGAQVQAGAPQASTGQPDAGGPGRLWSSIDDRAERLMLIVDPRYLLMTRQERERDEREEAERERAQGSGGSSLTPPGQPFELPFSDETDNRDEIESKVIPPSDTALQPGAGDAQVAQPGTQPGNVTAYAFIDVRTTSIVTSDAILDATKVIQLDGTLISPFDGSFVYVFPGTFEQVTRQLQENGITGVVVETNPATNMAIP